MDGWTVDKPWNCLLDGGRKRIIVQPDALSGPFTCCHATEEKETKHRKGLAAQQLKGNKSTEWLFFFAGFFSLAVESQHGSDEEPGTIVL